MEGRGMEAGLTRKRACERRGVLQAQLSAPAPSDLRPPLVPPIGEHPLSHQSETDQQGSMLNVVRSMALHSVYLQQWDGTGRRSWDRH